MNQYYAQPAAFGSVASASDNERRSFLVKTYLHLTGAIFAFVFLEAALIVSGLWLPVAQLLSSSWMVTLLLFMGAGWLARSWARNGTSVVTQYAGFAMYVVTWAVLFTLPIGIAISEGMGDAIPAAGVLTLVVFGGLTGVVFLSGRDFSFLRGIIALASIGALVAIGASLLLGFNLGIWFAYAMVVLSAGSILYNTSNILHHYRTDQYVGAALELFADVALLFWYILQIFMNRRN